MKNNLTYIIEQIQIKNLLHSKRILKNLKTFDQEYFDRADAFLLKYEVLLKNDNKSFDYAINCYLQMLADTLFSSPYRWPRIRTSAQSYSLALCHP